MIFDEVIIICNVEFIVVNEEVKVVVIVVGGVVC